MKISPQNSSGTDTNVTENTGLNWEICREKYMSPEKRQKTIDDLRLIW